MRLLLGNCCSISPLSIKKFSIAYVQLCPCSEDRRSIWYLPRCLKQVWNCWLSNGEIVDVEGESIAIATDYILDKVCQVRILWQFMFQKSGGAHNFNYSRILSSGHQLGRSKCRLIKWLHITISYWSHHTPDMKFQTLSSISFATFWQLTSDFPINFPIRFHFALLSCKIYSLNCSF